MANQLGWRTLGGDTGFGSAPMNPYAAKNVQLQNQRNSDVANYVNTMSDPTSPMVTAGFNADLGGARGYLNSFLQSNPSQMANPFASQVTDYQKRLSDLLDNPDSIQNSAAYKFNMDQGLDALNRQLGAKGLLNSGNRLLETEKFGQGLASQEYGNQFKRLSDLYGTNANAYIGDQNANTNQWQAQGNLLSDFYKTASNNVNQNSQVDNSNRLGWAKQYSDISAKPEWWGITNAGQPTVTANRPTQFLY